MKILLTGATSFSGLWFARAFAAKGFDVIAPVRLAVESYTGVRAERLKQLGSVAEVVPNVEFGNDAFLSLVAKGNFDVLCHHAAHVADYKSPDFDVSAAVAANTRGFRQLLELTKERAFKGVVSTGSAFEPNEGAGDTPLRAFSPYGLSKAFTNATLEFWCHTAGIPFGKFVIANPFGPYEEPRFCEYLMKNWAQGHTPQVLTPDYVRDNIHIDALARAYVSFTERLTSTGISGRLSPSMYVETQGAFAKRFAQEIGSRVSKSCNVDLGKQTNFSEPMIRINTDRLDYSQFGFSEVAAWDAIAEYYASRFDLG